MTSRTTEETLLAGAISILLLIFAGIAVYLIINGNVRGFAAASPPGTYFDTAIFFGFIAYTDYPQKIRDSKYLRSLAGLYISFLFFLGFIGLFSFGLQRYENLSQVIVIAVACIVSLVTLAKLVQHHASMRRLTDD